MPFVLASCARGAEGADEGAEVRLVDATAAAGPVGTARDFSVEDVTVIAGGFGDGAFVGLTVVWGGAHIDSRFLRLAA